MSNKTDNQAYGRLLPLAEAAPLMGMSVWTLRDMALRGEVATVKIGTRPGKRGGRRLIPESEIRSWIQRNLKSG